MLILFCVPWLLLACDSGGGAPGAVGGTEALPPLVYVANTGSDNLSAFQVDSKTFVLTEVTGSPYAAGTAPVGIAGDASERLVFVGNTVPLGQTISVFIVEAETGVLTEAAGSPIATFDSPSSLATFQAAKALYVGLENDGEVHLYRYDGTSGSVTFVSDFFPSNIPAGVAVWMPGPCFYATDSFTNEVVWAVLTSLGGIGIEFPRATGTAPGEVAVHAGAEVLFVSNTDALANSVSAYRIDPVTCGIIPAAGSPFALGATPDGLAIHPGGFLYVATSSGIAAFTFTPGAVLTALAGSPYAAGTSVSDVFVVPEHGLLFATFDGAGQMRVYRIDPATGDLTETAGSPYAAGTTPARITVLLPSSN